MNANNATDTQQRRSRQRRHNGFSNTGGILASLQPTSSSTTKNISGYSIKTKRKDLKDYNTQKDRVIATTNTDSSSSVAMNGRHRKSRQMPKIITCASSTSEQYADDNSTNNNLKFVSINKLTSLKDVKESSINREHLNISTLSSPSLSPPPPASRSRQKTKVDDEQLRPRPLFQYDDQSSCSSVKEEEYSDDTAISVSIDLVSVDEESIGETENDDGYDDVDDVETDTDNDSEEDDNNEDVQSYNESSSETEEEIELDNEETDIEYDEEDDVKEKDIVVVVNSTKDYVEDEDYIESSSDTDEELELDSDSSLFVENDRKNKDSSKQVVTLSDDEDASTEDTEDDAEVEIDNDNSSMAETSVDSENNDKDIMNNNQVENLDGKVGDDESETSISSDKRSQKSNKENIMNSSQNTDDLVDDNLVTVLDDFHLDGDDDDEDDDDIMIATIVEDDEVIEEKSCSTPYSSKKDHNTPNGSPGINKSAGEKLTYKNEDIDSEDSQNNKEAAKTTQEDKKPRKQVRFRREGSIQRGQWSLGSKIGTGAFGVVHVGMNRKTGTLMAVKSVQLGKAIISDARREIELLRSLDHINIVRYLGAEMDSASLHIFQEWVPGGSVTSLLQKFGPFSLPTCRSYLLQILSGLSYLHENRVLHRDIKGGNVLVNDSGIVKLADFGASKRQKQQLDMEHLTVRGTPYFMAPEVFEEKYGAKADVWSVGCVAFQMVTAQPPWKAMGLTNQMSLFMHLKSTEGPPTLDFPQTIGNNVSDIAALKSILQICFARDPSARPSAKSLMTESFLTNYEEQDDEYSQTSGNILSPGAFTVSNWESMISPDRPSNKLIFSSPCNKVGFSSPAHVPRHVKKSFLSPPFLPVHKAASPAISSLSGNSSFQIDPKDWPDWAKKSYNSQNKKEIGRHGDGKTHHSGNASLSFALSTDSNSQDPSRSNPFGRENDQSEGSLSTLHGLQFTSKSERHE